MIVLFIGARMTGFPAAHKPMRAQIGGFCPEIAHAKEPPAAGGSFPDMQTEMRIL
ncbi:MAG TPA: hypothetical protein VF440_00175 [Novosphingobium sp.]